MRHTRGGELGRALGFAFGRVLGQERVARFAESPSSARATHQRRVGARRGRTRQAETDRLGVMKEALLLRPNGSRRPCRPAALPLGGVGDRPNPTECGDKRAVGWAKLLRPPLAATRTNSTVPNSTPAKTRNTPLTRRNLRPTSGCRPRPQANRLYRNAVQAISISPLTVRQEATGRSLRRRRGRDVPDRKRRHNCSPN